MSHHDHFQDTNNFTHSSPGVKEAKLCTARTSITCIIWTPGPLPLESALTTFDSRHHPPPPTPLERYRNVKQMKTVAL